MSYNIHCATYSMDTVAADYRKNYYLLFKPLQISKGRGY